MKNRRLAQSSCLLQNTVRNGEVLLQTHPVPAGCGLALGVAEEAAFTGVHGGHEHEVGGERHGAGGAGDILKWSASPCRVFGIRSVPKVLKFERPETGEWTAGR
jgi:hypothetical protein